MVFIQLNREVGNNRIMVFIQLNRGVENRIMVFMVNISNVRDFE